ncbi:MAG: hypothetical protein JWO41_561 [Candidatus Saccharibacteria bacterium]|nr:hypothetical protein [Candidatus Saccharibacteria bacterium]
MTRFLSESLGAAEPYFQTELRKLERAHGNPSADISLSTKTEREARAKVRELGLDPKDTTGKELYQALLERVRADDARLVKTLRTRAATHISAEGDIVAGMVHALKDAKIVHSGLALKSTKFKTLMKRNPPKRAMKRLGYRSLDSYLKHESPALVLTAARLCENAAWQKTLLDEYKKLKSSDFEARTVTIAHPNTARWQDLAHSSVATTRHNVLSLPELGAVVILPLPANAPAGATTASLAFALHALNDLRASSSFLKLSLMRRDFGAAVQTVAKGQPALEATILDQVVPWHIVQRYYGRLQHLFNEDLFAPHIQLEDMSWPMVEEFLSHIEPTLEFWHESAALGILAEHQPVSLNIVDAALNLCNQLPFDQRIVQYYQQSLWHEIVLKYLKHDTVESSVMSQLQPQLELATN